MTLLQIYKIFITALSFLMVLYILYEIMKERRTWGKLIKGAFIYLVWASVSFFGASFSLNVLGLLYGGNYVLDFVSQTFFLFGFIFTFLIVLKVKDFLKVLK